MKKIRVLQVVSGLDVGGLETIAMNIVRYCDRAKLQFAFLVYGDRIGAYEEEAKELGCRIIHMEKPSGYPAFYQALKKTIRKYGPFDIVYSHTFFSSGIVLRAAKACGVKKCIAHAHNTERPFDKTLSRRVFYAVMRKWLNKYADVCFACSKAAGEYVYGKDSSFLIAKNGIKVEDFAFSQEGRERVRAEFSLGNKLVIGNVGRFSEAKNHLFLIHVFAEFETRQPNSRLLLVGDGKLQDAAKSEAEKLGLKDKVLFTGTRSDIPSLLSAMDIFVFPSIHEGLGISAVEAQASGLPVLCSSSVPEEVKVTDTLKFKSLADGALSWAEDILTLCRTCPDRQNMSAMVREAGYDIQDSIAEIEKELLN